MSDPRPTERDEERAPSILSALPRTRPQRPSRRRTAGPGRPAEGVERSKSKRAAATTDPTPRRTPAATEPVPRRGNDGDTADPTPRRTPAATEPVPRQGYDGESELGVRTPVAPPSASELLGSLAGLAGELAQSGVSAGGRLLRGALARLSSS
ncbi:MAG: hypothetical protein ACYCUM_01045 [Solirubrobacteraceae bacterium]